MAEYFQERGVRRCSINSAMIWCDE